MVRGGREPKIVSRRAPKKAEGSRKENRPHPRTSSVLERKKYSSVLI